MRGLFVFLNRTVSAGAAFAQEATDTPTPTITPTYSFSRFIPAIAPETTEEAPGQDAALTYVVDAGNIMNALLGFGLVILTLIEIVLNVRGRGNG